MSNEKFNQLNSKVDNLGTKVDKLETKFDNLEALIPKVEKLETLIPKVEKLETLIPKVENLEKITLKLEAEITSKLDFLIDGFKEIGFIKEEIKEHDETLEKHDDRIFALEQAYSNLK